MQKRFIKPEDAERGFYKEYVTLADALNQVEAENGFSHIENAVAYKGMKGFTKPQIMNAYKIWFQEVSPNVSSFTKFLTWYLVSEELTTLERWQSVDTVQDMYNAKNEAENANIYVTSQKGSYRKEAAGQNDHRNGIKKELRNEAKRDVRNDW